MNVDLRVAVIRVAEPVEGADKLLRLEVDLGEEELRQIVAGIAGIYTPEELLGRRIIVVANLKPVTLKGVESNGMLLAASKGKTLRLVGPDGPIDTGAKVG